MPPAIKGVLKMEVKAKRNLYFDVAGRVPKGHKVDLPTKQANEYIKLGWVEKYDTKVVHQEPETPEAKPSESGGGVEGETVVDVGAAKSTKSKGK
jgi:hypothetical protein